MATRVKVPKATKVGFQYKMEHGNVIADVRVHKPVGEEVTYEADIEVHSPSSGMTTMNLRFDSQDVSDINALTRVMQELQAIMRVHGKE